MELSSTAPVNVNELLRLPRPRAPWSLSRRLRWTWERNPAHVENAPASKRRWKREGKIQRAIQELPVILAGLGRLSVRTGDDRLSETSAALALITPEGLGLLWYEPQRPGGGKARGRWYIPASADEAVSAALAVITAAYRLMLSHGQAFMRETRLRLAGALAALRREGPVISLSTTLSPHTQRQEFLGRNSCSSEVPPASYFEEKYARHARGGSEEVQ